jgi:hypothetical protein
VQAINRVPERSPDRIFNQAAQILVAAFAVTSATFAFLLASGCTSYSEDGKPPAEPTFATTQVRTFSAAGSTSSPR